MTRKFRNRRGESFIETIAAMLIISLGMLMLAGAIVTAARVNDRASSTHILVVPPNPDSGDAETSTMSNPNLFGKISVSADPDDPDDPGYTFFITVYTIQPEGGESNGNALYYYTSR